MVLLDDLDLTLAHQAARQPQADLAATRNHDAAHRLIIVMNGAQHFPNFLFVGQHKHLVTRQHTGLGRHRHFNVLPVDRHHAHLGPGKKLAEFANGVIHQRTALRGAHGHQMRALARKFQHLQRLGVVNELVDVMHHRLFGADHMGHAKTGFAQQGIALGELGRA